MKGDDWRKLRTTFTWEIITPGSNGLGNSNFLSGLLLNADSFAQRYQEFNSGISYDIRFPVGTLSDARWGKEYFGGNVASNIGFSFEMAIRSSQTERERFLQSNFLSMVGFGLALSELLSLGAAAGVGIALTGGLAIPALMLTGAAMYFVYNGSDPNDFKYFPLVYDLNQTGIFAGLTLSGVGQENALDYSGDVSLFWGKFLQADNKINIVGKSMTTLEFSKKIIDRLNDQNKIEESVHKKDTINSSQLP